MPSSDTLLSRGHGVKGRFGSPKPRHFASGARGHCIFEPEQDKVNHRNYQGLYSRSPPQLITGAVSLLSTLTIVNELQTRQTVTARPAARWPAQRIRPVHRSAASGHTLCASRRPAAERPHGRFRRSGLARLRDPRRHTRVECPVFQITSRGPPGLIKALYHPYELECERARATWVLISPQSSSGGN
jgi:hypothetical protein